MADKDRLNVYAASFSSVTDAETALATIEQLYQQEAVGTMDAAMIDKENGKPHVVKLLDRPRGHSVSSTARDDLPPARSGYVHDCNG